MIGIKPPVLLEVITFITSGKSGFDEVMPLKSCNLIKQKMGIYWHNRRVRVAKTTMQTDELYF